MKFHIDTGSNISTTCSLCGKHIKKNVYSWSVMDEEIFHWWTFFHYLIKHKERIWGAKLFLRHFGTLLFALLFTLILIPLKLACFPFWVLYEYVL